MTAPLRRFDETFPLCWLNLPLFSFRDPSRSLRHLALPTVGLIRSVSRSLLILSLFCRLFVGGLRCLVNRLASR